MTNLPYLRDEASAEAWRQNAQQLQKRAYKQWHYIRDDSSTELDPDLVDLILKAESAETRWRTLSGNRESCLFADKRCAPAGQAIAWCSACTKGWSADGQD